MIQLRALRLSLLNRIWMMSKYGICFTTVLTREREASADRSRVYHSFGENSVLSSSHFGNNARKPATVFSHYRKSRPETLSDRESLSSRRQPVLKEDEALPRLSESENAARLALEEQKDHLLAEAKNGNIETRIKSRLS